MRISLIIDRQTKPSTDTFRQSPIVTSRRMIEFDVLRSIEIYNSHWIPTRQSHPRDWSTIAGLNFGERSRVYDEMRHTWLLGREVYIIPSAVFMSALRIAANVSRILGTCNCQLPEFYNPKNAPGVTINIFHIPRSNEPWRIDYINHIHITEQAIRVNTKVRRRVVGDFGRGNDWAHLEVSGLSAATPSYKFHRTARTHQSGDMTW
jgi:hypothetical protein